MDDLINEFVAAKWPKRPGASSAQMNEVEAKLGFKFPQDYRSFLEWSNGGEAFIGELYIQIWAVGELIENYEGYHFEEFYPGVLGIASNMGGSCVGLDFRSDAAVPSLVAFAWISSFPADVVTLGTTFTDGMRKAIKFGLYG